MIKIQAIQALDYEQCHELIEASVDEDYDFVQKLWDEYQTGANRFDQVGAILLGGYLDTKIIAIGGLNQDPYLEMASIGRVRHLYVLPDYRRCGVGKQLVLNLIEHASVHFDILTLRTMTKHGDAFYKDLGFTDERRFDHVTHWLSLKTES